MLVLVCRFVRRYHSNIFVYRILIHSKQNIVSHKDKLCCCQWEQDWLHRRRELALLMAEPGKNWNSFETFIFVTLRGSSYKINQDPGREKSGRHFLQPFSRWPTSKIAKIKNKHNFGIINPMKLILVSNSMFLNMIYSLVYLKMHSEFTWP